MAVTSIDNNSIRSVLSVFQTGAEKCSDIYDVLSSVQGRFLLNELLAMDSYTPKLNSDLTNLRKRMEKAERYTEEMYHISSDAIEGFNEIDSMHRTIAAAKNENTNGAARIAAVVASSVRLSVKYPPFYVAMAVAVTVMNTVFGNGKVNPAADIWFDGEWKGKKTVNDKCDSMHRYYEETMREHEEWKRSHPDQVLVDKINELKTNDVGVNYGGDKYRNWCNEVYDSSVDGSYQAWCDRFTSYTLGQAGYKLHPGTCDDQRDEFAARGGYHPADSGYQPKTGDVVFLRYPPKLSTIAHVGIIDVAEDGTVYVLDGNSGGEDGNVNYKPLSWKVNPDEGSYIDGYGDYTVLDRF